MKSDIRYTVRTVVSLVSVVSVIEAVLPRSIIVTRTTRANMSFCDTLLKDLRWGSETQ